MAEELENFEGNIPGSPENSGEKKPPRKHVNTGKLKSKGSYPNRLLKALESIYSDPNASIPQKLQAIEISTEVLEKRPVPRRKTDKEKAVIAALQRKEEAHRP